jgi:hypothetical protein
MVVGHQEVDYGLGTRRRKRLSPVKVGILGVSVFGLAALLPAQPRSASGTQAPVGSGLHLNLHLFAAP